VIKIKDLEELERPVERLIHNGPSYLNNEELLSIILKTGTLNKSVKMISNEVLKKAKTLNGLKDISLKDLKEISGIGNMKAASILALVEISKRINYKIEPILYKKLTSTDMVFEHFKNLFLDEMQECFYCLYLDNNKRIISEKLLFKGTLNFSMVHPREIFKEAIKESASTIICLHNHPSGNITPSNNDIKLTSNLVEISKLMGIPIIDHLIIGKDKYYSFFENDRI
jgi:DNA repair protein radc